MGCATAACRRIVDAMAEELQVRQVRPDEYGSAGAVTERAYVEHAPPDSLEWAAYLERIGDIAGRAARATVLVATVDGDIVGTATVEIDQRIESDRREELEPDEAHLRMLGVDPARRRLGAGRRLVEAAIALARSRGKRRLTLETTPSMEAARALYASMGFRPTGTREVGPGLCFDDYELRFDTA
jgi:ribosomal protein S18 acetylase RimI-like enzyme